MVTNSAAWPLAISASLIPAAWVVANRLPRVPIRITWANWLFREIASRHGQFACGYGIDSRLVEFEKLAQRLGVAVAAGGAGELLDPHCGCVQQLVHHPAHGAGHLFALGTFQPGQ